MLADQSEALRNGSMAVADIDALLDRLIAGAAIQRDAAGAAPPPEQAMLWAEPLA
jgi:hypothetical protein